MSLEEREEEEVQRTLSINSIVKGQIFNGVCTAHYVDEDLKLRYSFKVSISIIHRLLFHSIKNMGREALMDGWDCEPWKPLSLLPRFLGLDVSVCHNFFIYVLLRTTIFIAG